MPVYQNTSVDTDKLIIGNCKIETAATAGGTFVNLGAGIVNDFQHVIEKYDVQAGNAPDPIEGIAEETCTCSFEMIEYDASVLTAIHCGAIITSTTSSVATIHAGGQDTMTPRAFRLTNTRTISGTTVQTILTIYYATLDNGPSLQFKSDNDSDPIAVMPATLTGKRDTSRTAGYQLYCITHDEI